MSVKNTYREMPWSNVVGCLVGGAVFFFTAWKAPLVIVFVTISLGALIIVVGNDNED